MADRPIIFSGPMVRALIEGRKTQTRRLAKVKWKAGANPDFSGWHTERVGPSHWQIVGGMGIGANIATPYAPGDRLYVREAHAILPLTAYRCSIGTGTIDQREHPSDGYSAAVFREGFDRSGAPRWRPPIHMPRWASRLTLTVTDVRVQRLQEITLGDICEEGLAQSIYDFKPVQRGFDAWAALWNSLHGPDAWDANPWVVALTFTVERRNIDAGGGNG